MEGGKREEEEAEEAEEAEEEEGEDGATAMPRGEGRVEGPRHGVGGGREIGMLGLANRTSCSITYRPLIGPGHWRGTWGRGRGEVPPGLYRRADGRKIPGKFGVVRRN